MANRRPQMNGRRMDYGRNDRVKNLGRTGVSPWQGGGPGVQSLLPLAGGSTEATLALANNLLTNILQSRQQAVPSLLDMPIRRDFGPDMGRYDRGGYVNNNRMGNQGNFRRTGNYNRAGERTTNYRKSFKPGDGPRNYNKNIPRKDADSKAKPVKESNQDGKKEEKEATNEGEEGNSGTPKTRYDDVDSSLLKCHICNKSMWDGRSFENHLSGRAHAIMMQKTAESYALTADTMRQEFKIIDMKRVRKAGQQAPRDFYCAMCDMYAADGATHRTTVGHRKLKKYLHPACTACHKEMPTRIELDEHRLTPEHLKNIHDKQEVVTKKRPAVAVISTLSIEQSYIRHDRQRYAKDQDQSKKEPKDDEEQQAEGEGENEAENEEGAEKKEDGQEIKQEPVDESHLLLDFNDQEEHGEITTEMIPPYSTERGVGNTFLSEFKCFQCRLCNKLLDSEETAAVHLKTWRHYQLYIRMLKEKISPPQETNKRSLNESEGEEPEIKRRKTEGEDDTENGLGGEDVDMKEEPQNESCGDIDNDNDNDNDNDLTSEWENTVDEILADEHVETNNEEQQEDNQELQEEVEEKEPSPEPPKVDVKPKGTPRGRGRGRRRY